MVGLPKTPFSLFDKDWKQFFLRLDKRPYIFAHQLYIFQKKHGNLLYLNLPIDDVSVESFLNDSDFVKYSRINFDPIEKSWFIYEDQEINFYQKETLRVLKRYFDQNNLLFIEPVIEYKKPDDKEELRLAIDFCIFAQEIDNSRLYPHEILEKVRSTFPGLPKDYVIPLRSSCSLTSSERP